MKMTVINYEIIHKTSSTITHTHCRTHSYCESPDVGSKNSFLLPENLEWICEQCLWLNLLRQTVQCMDVRTSFFVLVITCISRYALYNAYTYCSVTFMRLHCVFLSCILISLLFHANTYYLPLLFYVIWWPHFPLVAHLFLLCLSSWLSM